MNQPEIHELRNIKNFVLGGHFETFYCVNFGNPSFSYMPEHLPCMFCRKTKSAYQYWESENDSVLFCGNDNCVISGQVWSKSHPVKKKLVVKIIED